MEELVLTDPVVVPEKVTSTYKVRMLTLNWDAQHTPASEPGIVYIELVDNHGERLTHRYVGDEATRPDEVDEHGQLLDAVDAQAHPAEALERRRSSRHRDRCARSLGAGVAAEDPKEGVVQCLPG